MCFAEGRLACVDYLESMRARLKCIVAIRSASSQCYRWITRGQVFRAFRARAHRLSKAAGYAIVLHVSAC